MDIGITKMSSKGQIVIPVEMRKDLKEGDKLVIIKNKKQLILRKANDFDKKLLEDLEFARRTEEAWKRYERGEFKSMDADDFIRELKKWSKLFLILYLRKNLLNLIKISKKTYAIFSQRYKRGLCFTIQIILSYQRSKFNLYFRFIS